MTRLDSPRIVSYAGLAAFGLIAGLVDRSLLVADISGRETRYRSLETLHRYGRDRLSVSDDAEEVRRR